MRRSVLHNYSPRDSVMRKAKQDHKANLIEKAWWLTLQLQPSFPLQVVCHNRTGRDARATTVQLEDVDVSGFVKFLQTL